MKNAQEDLIRKTLRAMAQKNGYAMTSGYLEGVLLTVLEFYVKEKDVEKVVRSFGQQALKLEKETS